MYKIKRLHSYLCRVRNVLPYKAGSLLGDCRLQCPGNSYCVLLAFQSILVQHFQRGFCMSLQSKPVLLCACLCCSLFC